MATVVETAPLVLDVGLVLMVAGTMGYIARRLGAPAVVGYLITGLLVSPFTPGYVADSKQLTLLADIGVILLLFEVGIEVDIRRISREKIALLWGAPLQVLISLIVGFFVFSALGISTLGALLLGLCVALSSSVVIVNITRSLRRTTDTSTEEAMLGWSVLQDLTGVLAAALVLTIFGSNEKPLVQAIFGLIGFLVSAFVFSKVMPRILRFVRWERDLFLIYSISSGLVISSLGTVLFDIPMALAAFVAGIAVNQSVDTDEARKVILPFRDLFAVLFFVIIGSLIDFSLINEALPFALLLLGLLVLSKALPAIAVARITRMDVRPYQLAVGLSQIGEFSFVLGSLALAEGAISQVQFAGTLISVVISIIASVLLVRIRI